MNIAADDAHEAAILRELQGAPPPPPQPQQHEQQHADASAGDHEDEALMSGVVPMPVLPSRPLGMDMSPQALRQQQTSHPVTSNSMRRLAGAVARANSEATPDVPDSPAPAPAPIEPVSTRPRAADDSHLPGVRPLAATPVKTISRPPRTSSTDARHIAAASVPAVRSNLARPPAMRSQPSSVHRPPPAPVPPASARPALPVPSPSAPSPSARPAPPTLPPPQPATTATVRLQGPPVVALSAPMPSPPVAVPAAAPAPRPAASPAPASAPRPAVAPTPASAPAPASRPAASPSPALSAPRPTASPSPAPAPAPAPAPRPAASPSPGPAPRPAASPALPPPASSASTTAASPAPAPAPRPAAQPAPSPQPPAQPAPQAPAQLAPAPPPRPQPPAQPSVNSALARPLAAVVDLTDDVDDLPTLEAALAMPTTPQRGIKRSPTRSSNGKDDEDEDEDRAARVRRARRDLSSSPADGRPSLILLDSLSSSPPRRETNMWSPAHQATAPAAAEHAVPPIEDATPSTASPQAHVNGVHTAVPAQIERNVPFEGWLEMAPLRYERCSALEFWQLVPRLVCWDRRAPRDGVAPSLFVGGYRRESRIAWAVVPFALKPTLCPACSARFLLNAAQPHPACEDRCFRQLSSLTWPGSLKALHVVRLSGRQAVLGSGSSGIALWPLGASSAAPLDTSMLRGDLCVDVDPSGTRVVAGDRSGTVCLWDLSSAESASRVLDALRTDAGVSAVAFNTHANETYDIAVGSSEGYVLLHNQRTGQAVPVAAGSDEVSAMCLRGSDLACGNALGRLRVWSLEGASAPALRIDVITESAVRKLAWLSTDTSARVLVVGGVVVSLRLLGASGPSQSVVFVHAGHRGHVAHFAECDGLFCSIGDDPAAATGPRMMHEHADKSLHVWRPLWDVDTDNDADDLQDMATQA